MRRRGTRPGGGGRHFWSDWVRAGVLTRLSPTGQTVGQAFAAHVGWDGRGWPGVNLLARITGLSKRAILRGYRGLQDAGVLEPIGWEPVPGIKGPGLRVYQLNPPPKASVLVLKTDTKKALKGVSFASFKGAPRVTANTSENTPGRGTARPALRRRRSPRPAPLRSPGLASREQEREAAEIAEALLLQAKGRWAEYLGTMLQLGIHGPVVAAGWRMAVDLEPARPASAVGEGARASAVDPRVPLHGSAPGEEVDLAEEGRS